jgi:hypothetical protein
LSQIQDTVPQNQWGRHGNASTKVAATAICRDAVTKKALFDPYTGSSIYISVLKSWMGRIVLKTFHTGAGASMMGALKRKKHGAGSERLS